MSAESMRIYDANSKKTELIKKLNLVKNILVDTELSERPNEFTSEIEEYKKEIDSILVYIEDNEGYFETDSGMFVFENDLKQYTNRIETIMSNYENRDDIEFINKDTWFNVFNSYELLNIDAMFRGLAVTGNYPDHLLDYDKYYFSFLLNKGLIEEDKDFVFDFGEDKDYYLKNYSVKTISELREKIKGIKKVV